MPNPRILLDLLDRVRQVGDHQWEALCPAHDDTSPSLSVGLANDGRVLARCHKGCTFFNITTAVGLLPRELNPQSNGQASGKTTATYDYHDAQGVLIFQVCRIEPGRNGKKKDFRQHRPDGKGGWVWSVKGVRKVLYRLPKLLAADPKATVFIVEGEKDVDRLVSLGLVATTNAGGAGGWLKSYANSLKGRDVVILPDNDDAGRAHEAKAAESLAGKAASIRAVALPDLPDGGDVSDWLDAGGTADELRKIVSETPEFVAEPKLQPLITNAYPRVESELPRSMPEILKVISDVTDNWPRRVGNSLFADVDGGVIWLSNASALVGFLGKRTGQSPRFVRGAGFHTQGEVFETLRWTTQDYRAVETLPHHPPMEGCYYTSACQNIKPGGGLKLRELVGMFLGETDVDADLILAAFLTPGWGGAGKRPSFGITSDDGRGSGKTTLAMMIGRVWGGRIEISPDEATDVVKQRLLSPDGLSKRVIVIDNLKSMRFSSAGLEALVTADVISGKRMYVGEASRPNNLTWLTTLNGVSFATDWAQRSVIIKLKKPAYSATWRDDVEAFIDANREVIIADCIGFLQRPAEGELVNYSRWASWEKDVLSRVVDPAEAQKVILDRQGEADAESEESAELQDAIATKLKELHYDPSSEAVFLPNRVIALWLGEVVGERLGTNRAGRIIRQKIREGLLPRLQECPNRISGRGYVWYGENATVDTEVLTQIEDNIETKAREGGRLR